jgi:hypothetical protein
MFYKAVKKFGKDKAQGSDGFKPKILQKLNHKSKHI